MSRLVKRYKDKDSFIICDKNGNEIKMLILDENCCMTQEMQDCIRKLADYEDAEELKNKKRVTLVCPLCGNKTN